MRRPISTTNLLLSTTAIGLVVSSISTFSAAKTLFNIPIAVVTEDGKPRFIGATSGSAQSQRQSHMNMSTTTKTTPALPEIPQRYRLLERHQVSPDSCLLQFGLPPGREHLGSDPELPTCIKVTMPEGTYTTTTTSTTSESSSPALSKSYSPVSHPHTRGTFDLLVKAYPYEPGGGVGAYLCNLEPSLHSDSTTNTNTILASLKSPRVMHGSPVLYRRWKHVGLVAGGTGLAPLFQLATMLLLDDYTETVDLLFVNRHEEDILLHQELDRLAAQSSSSGSRSRFRVTYALTGDETKTTTDTTTTTQQYHRGRGTADLARRALPPPNHDNDTMIFVCGTDGFVAHWGGPVGRAPPAADGKKGPKIQGPLLGILQEAGYQETEVFKY